MTISLKMALFKNYLSLKCNPLDGDTWVRLEKTHCDDYYFVMLRPHQSMDYSTEKIAVIEVANYFARHDCKPSEPINVAF